VLGRQSLILAVVIATGVLVECGRKLDPLPPIVEVPETTTDLTVRQVEHDAVLTWSYPTLTRAGRPLTDLQRVTVWRLEVPPGQEQGITEELARQLMLSRGRIVATLEGKGLENATEGDKLVYRDPLPAVPTGTTPPTYGYAVRSRRRDGTTSALSNIVGLQPHAVPPAVKGLEVRMSESGITVTWQGEEGEAYLVERRSAAGGGWEVISKEPLKEPTFTDGTAAQGTTWQYRVRVVKDGVWGPPTPTLEVPYPDVYPPPLPAAMVCLPEPARVLIRWEPSSEAGTHYTVLRRRSGSADWTTLAADLTGLEYADAAPEPGETEYAVRAVDPAGNASEPVTCTVRVTR
jgi:hypothetical protein